MNLGEIREGVQGIIPSSGMPDEDINLYINEAFAYVAGEVTIPELKGIATVSTVALQSYADLSALTGGFSGNLRRVKRGTTDLTVYATLDLMFDNYDDITIAGDVEAVALEGNFLWYAFIPAVPQVLTVLYYKKPTLLVDDTDIPSLLPSHLHRKLLVNGAAWMIWDNHEDGVDGEKLNTNNHMGHMNSGITSLRVLIGKHRKHYVSSVWSE